MRVITLLLMLFSMTSFSQIEIDDVGDGWKNKVEKSLELIKKTDIKKYNDVVEVCHRIGYWNGGFSTTEGKNVILISKKDIEYGNLNNISAVIIHESKHLYYSNNNILLNENYEEILSYKYELDYLNKIPNVERWLINHVENMIKHYRNLYYKKQ